MGSVIDKLRKDREETIQCLRTGQYGYANETIKRLMPYMQPEFAAQVSGHFNACNYVRVADLLEHKWKVVELPPEAGDEISDSDARVIEMDRKLSFTSSSCITSGRK